MKAGNTMFKKIIGTLFGFALIGSVASNALAGSPQFNHLQGDLEFLTGRNTTKGATDLTDPVSADPGDQVEGVIYYHNGVDNAAATNVHVKVVLPNTLAKDHVIQGSLTSDNTPSITDTIVNGQVVGKSNLTILGSAQTNLAFVPGSVRWFPDGSQTAQALPAGQNGSEILSATGLSLGDIAGCWSHAGFVMFKVSLTAPQGGPQIEKAKSAFNNTQAKDATTVVAHAGDQVTYTLTTKNSGSADQASFVIEDGIRDILDYADVVAISDAGVKVDVVNDPIRDNQVLVRYPALTIPAGQTVTRTFTVKVKDPIPTNPQNGNAFDFTMFNSYGNKVVVVVEHPSVVLVAIQKDVRNVSKNEGAFQDTNTASPGDVLEYQIRTKNMGNKVANGTLKDVLPNAVTYVDKSIVVKRGSDAITTTGDLFGDGIVIPNMNQNVEFTIMFRVTTSDKLADSTNLVNKASITLENQQKEDTASTLILSPVKPVAATPTTPAPSPTKGSLPAAGANPFGLMTILTGAAYTWISRRRMNKQLENLSAYVKIV